MVLEWTEARENLIDSMARTLATQHPIGEEEWGAITRAKFLIRVFPDKYNPLPGGIMYTEGRPL